ncbi:von Willebrand factor type A domain-containing protein [Phanerochaete sordida]|uniref:von Willebrand factor type A domain-containing protein n=1 Tax=Phanerochaete sordida TaxID=48140 RepID=A0A9P3LDZ0_9APHY|nr:von Willebrand factor type A domain-containing protein [Phanerochaete sordida]
MPSYKWAPSRRVVAPVYTAPHPLFIARGKVMWCTRDKAFVSEKPAKARRNSVRVPRPVSSRDADVAPPPPYPAPSFSGAHKLAEDPLQLLAHYNTVVVVDDSGSMDTDGRWEEAKNAIRSLGEWAAQYDDDGIDLYFLNHRTPADGYGRHNLKSAFAVMSAFDNVFPDGSTPLGARLSEILDAHVKACAASCRRFLGLRVGPARPKPINVLVVTDGRPTDRDGADPKAVLVRTARRLDALKMPRDQVGVSFVQVGADADAAEYLRELDDDLPACGVRDMVDTTPYTTSLDADPERLVKILLGGVHRRVDVKGGQVMVQRRGK